MDEQAAESLSERHPEGQLRDEILRRLARIEGGAWANRLRPAVGFSSDDRRRITEYVGGVTRLFRRLDFLIDAFSRRSRALDPLVRQILRIGVYELVELQRMPAPSVFASVEQAKRLANKGAASFVNGLLRTLSGNLGALPEPNTGDRVRDAAIRWSHPDWMARRWTDRFGLDEAVRLMAYNNLRPVHGVRINMLKTTTEAFCATLDRINAEWEPSQYLPEFLRLPRLQPVIEAGIFESGLAAIQDESAGLISRVLKPRPGEFVIDACAAPGGKMIHAALLMNNQGRVFGVDTNGKRLAAGLAAARTHGVSIVDTATGDFRSMVPSETLPPADAVLLDAPCSGFGVLARRPDLRWRRTEASIRELVELQDELLEAATAFVKPGGRLVYATCTITPEENEDRVESFLSRHSEFHLESVTGDLDPFVEHGGCLVTIPHIHEMDGAYAARLRRN